MARAPDGVLRSGWAVPDSQELLHLSAVKAKLAAMCMFGGLGSPRPENLLDIFLKHRENVSLFLQAHACEAATGGSRAVEQRESQMENRGENVAGKRAGEPQRKKSSAERSLNVRT